MILKITQFTPDPRIPKQKLMVAQVENKRYFTFTKKIHILSQLKDYTKSKFELTPRPHRIKHLFSNCGSLIKGQFVRKFLIILLFFSLKAPLLFAADSDTTYGRIRIKKRTTSSSGSESGASNDDESSFVSCISGVSRGCLDALINSRGETTITYNRDQSDNDQPRKKKNTAAQDIEPCGYSSSPFHFSGGVTMGGVVYSKGIAAGFILGGATGFTWFPDTSFGLRLALEPTAALDNILVDMEKDVFVDGLKIGTTVFSGERGNEFILPLTAQILYIPPVSSRATFLSFGGGICYNREITRGTQTLNGNASQCKITFNQWCPLFHFGLGFFIPLDKTFGIFEFGYTIIANKNSLRFETPGDNSRYGHMPAISFSISTP